MRSISIVYKRNRQQSIEDTNPLSKIKRSVDEYYGKLIQKQKHKEKMDVMKNQLKERYKLQTSQSQKRADKFNILSTLSIAPMSILQVANQIEKKFESQKNLIIIKKTQKSKSALKGLKLPQTLQHIEQQQNPQKNLHCKLKKMYINKSSQKKDIIVVISANLLLNEHCFWSQESVDDQAAKYWKNLQNYTNIAIVCQKEESSKKLLRFYGLYVIVPLKQIKNITVSYQQIQSDFNIVFHQSNFPLVGKDERKMIVINGLSVQNMKDLSYKSFYNSIPIIKNRRSIVHYTKIQVNDKNRFGSVIKILSQETPSLIFNINPILHQFQTNKKQYLIQSLKCPCNNNTKKQLISTTNIEQININTKIEQIKNNYIHFIAQSLSQNLNDKIQYDKTENSVQFIIGDMLRRNLKVFKSYYQYIGQFGQYNQRNNSNSNKIHEKGCKNHQKINFSFKKYRNNTYLWQF